MFRCWVLVDRGDVGGCEHGRLDCGLLIDLGIVRFGVVTVGAMAGCAPRCVGSSRAPLKSSGSIRRRAVPLCSRRGWVGLLAVGGVPATAAAARARFW